VAALPAGRGELDAVIFDAAANPKQTAFRQSFHSDHTNLTLHRDHSHEIVKMICGKAERTAADFAGNERRARLTVESVAAQILGDGLDHGTWCAE